MKVNKTIVCVLSEKQFRSMAGDNIFSDSNIVLVYYDAVYQRLGNGSIIKLPFRMDLINSEYLPDMEMRQIGYSAGRYFVYLGEVLLSFTTEFPVIINGQFI